MELRCRGAARRSRRTCHSVATRDAAVLGCGVIGFTTARILQNRGCNVTIYAEALPPNHVKHCRRAVDADGGVSRRRRRRRFESFSKRPRSRTARSSSWSGRVTAFAGSTTTISRCAPIRKGQYDIEVREGVALFADVARIDPASTPFSAPYVRRFASMLIEPNTYLPAMLEDFYIAGGRVRVRRLANVRDVAHLPHDTIVNCTGLGSHDLFGDDDLYPIRGQLTVLEPQPEVNYIVVAPGPSYMFPRADGIVIGGTFQSGDWSTEPDSQTVRDKLAALRALYRLHDTRPNDN